MLVTQRGFRMFTEYDLGINLNNFISKIGKEIESDRNVLNQDEEEYSSRKVLQYNLKPLIVYPDKIRVSQQEVQIEARYFPSNFMVERGESYPKPVITFHLPFEGDAQFLRCKPSTFIMNTEEINVSGNEIIFEIINFSNDAEQIQKKKHEFLSLLQGQIQNVNNQINTYNSQLTSHINTFIKRAKEKMNTQDDLLAKLGTPIITNE